MLDQDVIEALREFEGSLEVREKVEAHDDGTCEQGCAVVGCDNTDEGSDG